MTGDILLRLKNRLNKSFFLNACTFNEKFYIILIPINNHCKQKSIQQSTNSYNRYIQDITKNLKREREREREQRERNKQLNKNYLKTLK